MPDNFEYMTAEEVAENLGVTTRAVTKMALRGEFPTARKISPTKKTSSWLIPSDEFKAYEKKRGQAAKADHNGKTNGHKSEPSTNDFAKAKSKKKRGQPAKAN